MDETKVGDLLEPETDLEKLENGQIDSETIYGATEHITKTSKDPVMGEFGKRLNEYTERTRELLWRNNQYQPTPRTLEKAVSRSYTHVWTLYTELPDENFDKEMWGQAIAEIDIIAKSNMDNNLLNQGVV